MTQLFINLTQKVFTVYFKYAHVWNKNTLKLSIGVEGKFFFTLKVTALDQAAHRDAGISFSGHT